MKLSVRPRVLYVNCSQHIPSLAPEPNVVPRQVSSCMLYEHVLAGQKINFFWKRAIVGLYGLFLLGSWGGGGGVASSVKLLAD